MNTKTACIIIANDHAGIRAIVRRVLAEKYNVVAAAADRPAVVAALNGVLFLLKSLNYSEG